MTSGQSPPKNPSLQGAALFYLSLERSGGKKLGGVRQIVRETFQKLGVTKEQVERYIKANRRRLNELLKQGTRASACPGTKKRDLA